MSGPTDADRARAARLVRAVSERLPRDLTDDASKAVAVVAAALTAERDRVLAPVLADLARRMVNTVDPARSGFDVRAECVALVRAAAGVPQPDGQDGARMGQEAAEKVTDGRTGASGTRTSTTLAEIRHGRNEDGWT